MALSSPLYLSYTSLMKNFTAAIFLIVVALLGSAGISWHSFAASDHPTLGIVHGETEKSALTYSCEKTDEVDKIKCKFSQATILPKSKPRDWSKRKQDLISEYRKMGQVKRENNAKEMCTLSKQMLGVLSGTVEAPDKDAMERMPAFQKETAMKMARSMLQYCQNSSEEGYVKFGRAGFEAELKTCKISSSSYSQIFKRQWNSSKNVWIVESTPTGSCGIVRLDRFEIAKPKYGLWNFFARKAVTNPSNRNKLLPCSVLDQKEYKYQWNSRDIYLNCEIVKFGP